MFLLRADGTTDPYYLRFSSKGQSSLVLGNSKAAQGIHPRKLNEILLRDDIYNFSFTISTSPYGPLYLEKIKEILKPKNKDGIFILTVDAWSLSSNSDDPNDSLTFSENNSILNTPLFSKKPNFFYLLKKYDKKFIELFINRNNSLFLHDDGWLEVSIEMDKTKIINRIERNADHYTKNYLPYWHFSETRLEYLSKAISYLKKFGKVYVVTLPVTEKILQIENQIVPNLDNLVSAICDAMDIPYINFQDRWANYNYTDGLHLHKESGAKLSSEIADYILINQ